MPITDNDLALFRERAKTELKSTGDIGRLAWDDVVEALCKEVARLRRVSRERGNYAKLRKAIETLVDLVDAWKDHLPQVVQDELEKAMKKAEAALAANP